MKPMDSPKGEPTLREGFLLIEVLTALSILGVLVVVIMLSLARAIAYNYDAQLRLRALNAATTMLEHLVQGRSAPLSGKKMQGCTVAVRYSKVAIDQKKNDKIIPDTGEPKEVFKVVVVTSEWESSSGEKKSVQLLTGMTIAKGQEL